MLIDMAVMHMVQMAVMQIINVVAVANRNVTASGSVLVIMVVMVWKLAVGHRWSSVLDNSAWKI